MNAWARTSVSVRAVGRWEKQCWLMVSARSRQQQVVLRQVCCSCFLITFLELLYLPGKIHLIEEAGDFLSINNWHGSPAPWTGILALVLAPGDRAPSRTSRWRWWWNKHLPIFSSLPQPMMRIWVLLPLYEWFASLLPWLAERWDSIISCRKSTLPWEGKQESLFGDRFLGGLR